MRIDKALQWGHFENTPLGQKCNPFGEIFYKIYHILLEN
jgi:hypothetical protein